MGQTTLEGKVVIQHLTEETYLRPDGTWTDRVRDAQGFYTVEDAKQECGRRKVGRVRVTIHYLTGDVSMICEG